MDSLDMNSVSTEIKTKHLSSGTENNKVEEPISENTDKPFNHDSCDCEHTLDEIIFKSLEKVKEYFFKNNIEEQKLADFMFQLLTLNANDLENQILNSETLDSLIEKMMQNDSSEFTDTFNDVFEKLFNRDSAQCLCDKPCSEKIDDLLEKLLGKDTKQLICQKFDSQSLDDLVSKLIDEKSQIEMNPQASHPNFDGFIEKLLGKDTETFIRKKLEGFMDSVTENIKDSKYKIDDVE